MLNNDQTRDKLQYILGTLHDGETGYREAAENATDPQLRSMLTNFGEERSRLAGQIETVIAQMGATPREHGSAGAALHRAWLNVRDAVTGHDDYAVVAEAERGEDAAVQNYQDVLKEDLPLEVKSLLEQQYSVVRANHDRVSALKNSMEATRNLKG